MDKKTQEQIDSVFREYFGQTPLNERFSDIKNQFYGLSRYEGINIKKIKEKTGDLLTSLLMLCNESEWDANELINSSLERIENKSEQYKSLGRKINVAILGGAFNPIHLGHIQLAQYVLDNSGVFDEVWLMPAYDHMYNKEMVDSENRLKMVELASQTDSRIKVFDYEIRNKLRGETFYFFKRLSEEKNLMDQYKFSMIIGQDNANSFHKWVKYEELEQMVKFVVVPRKGVTRNTDSTWYLNKPHIFLKGETNIMNISSTDIRNMVQSQDKKIETVLDKKVLDFIKLNNFYK